MAERPTIPPELAALLWVFNKATIRLGILRDRMEGCREAKEHELSLDEIPAWIEEQSAASAALETAITALVRDGQKQNQGWTEKDQPQEPEPSRDAEDADRLATLADYVDGGDLKIYHHSWLAKPHDPESGQSVVFVESGARRFE